MVVQLLQNTFFPLTTLTILTEGIRLALRYQVFCGKLIESQ